MKKYNRIVIVGMGDTHAGNVFGMLNPETLLWREGRKIHPTLTEPQTVIWDGLTQHIKEVVHLAGKDRIALVHVGDQTQGKKYMSELFSTSEADQMLIAEANFWPWLKLKNLASIRMAVGTSSHVFGEGTSEILVERMLSYGYSGIDVKLVYHGVCNMLGLTVDYAHHGPPPGKRNWLYGNEARYYLKSAMMDELDMGNVPAPLYLRGHYHTFIEEILYMQRVEVRYKSHLMILPAYCLLGEFARQVTQSAYMANFGLVAVEVINGKIYETHPFISSLDTRTFEEIP